MQSQMVIALVGARSLLEQEQNWDKGDVGPGFCPLRAVVRSANTLHLGIWWKLRLVLRLRAALPATHRRWWPECVIHYNADPAVTHADIMTWFDRAIDASSCQSIEDARVPTPQRT